MTSFLNVPNVNDLLAELPDVELNALLADCETVELTFGQELFQPGDMVTHVYFPIDSFISLLAVIDGGTRLEVTMAGREGMLGTSLVLGINEAPLLALVQGSGVALRISSARFEWLLEKCPVLHQRLNKYLYVVMTQLAKSAACNHFHPIEARLARWLLMTEDRANSDQLQLTHEFLAIMLGVRRAGVSMAASALQARGLIRYRRGAVVVLDRPGLIKAACECYTEDCALYARVMGSL